GEKAMRLRILPACLPCLVLASTSPAAGAEALRAGLIGLDTSHAGAFTAIYNDPKGPDHVPGVRVVAAFPGGSPDIPQSADRVGPYTAELRERWKVEIAADIPGLCQKVDVVLLLSVDGRRHLAQAREVIQRRKPLFIDKPMAASVAEAREIFRLAGEAKVPVFSSSALRFAPGVRRAREDAATGAVLGCEALSPASIEPHHPDLFWYGIHGVESLYAVMGPGCESVVRTHTEGVDLVTGRWRDGRIGSLRGIRKGAAPFSVFVFGEKRVSRFDGESAGSIYKPLLVEIEKFFRTGASPVPAEETLELLAFMEAADASRREGGRPVVLEPLTK
ncbi:MAG: Gfo/Idh/MocA family protein, partial [Thermoanaerobaculia bacterium]